MYPSLITITEPSVTMSYYTDNQIAQGIVSCNLMNIGDINMWVHAIRSSNRRKNILDSLYNHPSIINPDKTNSMFVLSLHDMIRRIH